MKAHTISFTFAAAIAALGAGCASSSDPYADRNQTARGAAAGAATGAVIGGVVGANSDRVSTEKGAAIGAVAGGIAGAAIGHRADEREAAARSQDRTYRGSTYGAYHVQTIPPSPVSEPQEYPPPQPSANSMWIRGHYVYTGTGYQWQPGRWEVPPPGTRNWVQPAWQPAPNGGYVYVQGHWQ